MTIYCRGIYGATTAESNTREAILAATRELLEQMIATNNLRVEDIVSVIFSTTRDLNIEFPAVAAREMGWNDTALFCTHEMNVPTALDHCIRVLMHWNTPYSADKIVHCYLNRAVVLRPG